MSTILAIDPGDQQSAYCLIEAATRRPIEFAKTGNANLLELLRINTWHQDVAAVEMIASYGMAVGASVFETCVWIGRFAQVMVRHSGEPMLVKRLPVKVHHTHSARAKDANVRQALIDRFGGGASNGGKGTKAEPGWFYGFAADVWSAYAIAVFIADTHSEETTHA